VSTILTTNLEPADWYPLFNNKSLVDALIDRFVSNRQSQVDLAG
jgi:hypothetical protein